MIARSSGVFAASFVSRSNKRTRPTATPAPSPDASASAEPTDGGTLPDVVSLRVNPAAPAPGRVGGLLDSLLALIFGS